MANITNGTVSVELTGGVGPYQYTLLSADNNLPIPQNTYPTFTNPVNGVQSNVFTFGNASDNSGNSGLAAGSYKVKIVDTNGCQTFSNTLIVSASTPTPTATAIPDPTATPVPDPTATPVPDPTATPVPDPTATAIPDPTATAIPDPTATPVPTATMYPTPTATMYPTPTATPVPTYSLSVNSPVVEGSNMTFTLTTTGLQDGDVVPFGLGGTATIGDDYSDVDPKEFVITNNSSTYTVTTFQDNTTESGGNETVSLTLMPFDGQGNGTFSESVTGEIVDTSQNPTPTPTATPVPDPTATPVPTATAIPDPTATPGPQSYQMNLQVVQKFDNSLAGLQVWMADIESPNYVQPFDPSLNWQHIGTFDDIDNCGSNGSAISNAISYTGTGPQFEFDYRQVQFRSADGLEIHAIRENNTGAICNWNWQNKYSVTVAAQYVDSNPEGNMYFKIFENTVNVNPDPTATPVPTATAIPDPTATAIPDPTATPVPTAEPVPTFALTNNGPVGEGHDLIFTLTTTNIPNGTEVAFTTGGDSTVNVDYTDNLPHKFVINNNTSTWTVTTLIDNSFDASTPEDLLVMLNATDSLGNDTGSLISNGQIYDMDPEPTAIPTATPVPPTATPVPPTATPVPPTATPVPEQADAYYFHLGSGGYPYAQDLIGGTLYKADNSVAANYDESFADMLANPGSYEQVNSLSTIVDGTSFTIPASSEANFYWLAIPVDMIGDDLTVHKRLEIDGAPADNCSASLAFVGPNGANYTLYKLNTVPMNIELPIVYVVNN